MARDFDYGTLTFEDRAEIHDALAVTTVKHISRAEGLFAAMPFDPAQSPSQILETVHLDPVPSTLEEVHRLANIANEPLADAAREALTRQPALPKVFKFMMDNRKENFVLASTHVKRIADVALLQSAWVEATEQDNWQERNGLVISRAVTTLQVWGMAASEVVQKMGHVFLSFPRTKSIQGLDIDPDLIDTNNHVMRGEIRDWMGASIPRRMRRRGGSALHLAWEGRTAEINYGDDHKPESIVLGDVTDGTIDLVKHAAVLPVVIWEEPDPVVILGDLTEVKNRRDVKRVQAWHRETLAHIIGISVDNITVET